MATTTNYSWTTPDDTGLVKDGASAIRTLGTSVDTTVKALNPETTLGDLAYRSSSANVKTRLGIGTTGQVLGVSGGLPAWTTISPSPTSDSARVATSQTTTSTSYTDLATAGPAVTLTTGTKALVIVTTTLFNSGVNNMWASYAVSGSTTIAGSDTVAIQWTNPANYKFRLSAASRLTTLTAGSNTFTMKYRVDAGTGTYLDREIIVIDLGS